MKKRTAIKHQPGKQRFCCEAPAAASVQLVGDFTHWQENPITLKKGADGIWRADVALEPGTHHYRFLVDDEWRDDPDCPVRAPNVFGSENSVRLVA
jgi:1,4-alpha-glucan branching enzyme